VRAGEGTDFAVVVFKDQGQWQAEMMPQRLTGGDRLLLSDVTAAVAWDLARQVTERLGVSVPADEDDVAEVWPAGDLGIFADLGMDEMVLGAVLSDLDAYADEQLLELAERLGFAEPYERVVEGASG
jgi:putative tRNA adenosine deaminase-associated protein